MIDPYFWQIPALAVVGVIAGFLNVLAGGGSLLTLPLLIFFGLPAATANGTNRVAIFCQNVFAITGFKRQGVFPIRLALLCMPPALLGSYLGANLAISVDEMLFRRLLALIMVGVLLFMIFDPMQRFRREETHMTPLRTVVLMIRFFGVDLVGINAVKVLVIFAFTAVALGVFVLHGQVDYVLGLSLAAGNSLGGWIATHYAVKKGHDWIKRFVIVTVLIFALKLLLP